MKKFHAARIRRASAQLAIFVPLYMLLAMSIMDTPVGLALAIALGGGLGVVGADSITRLPRSGSSP